MMKALSLTQPWATLIVAGAKRWETRSWQPHYRGLIAIHASKAFPKWAQEICGREPFRSALNCDPGELPTGAIIGVARIVRCVPTLSLNHDLDYAGVISERERAFGDYTNGREAWELADARPLVEPVPCRGALSLWTVPVEIARRV